MGNNKNFGVIYWGSKLFARPSYEKQCSISHSSR